MKGKLPLFNNHALLNLALTHSSYLNENSRVEVDNERLEFLGDAVIGFLVAQMLYEMYPTINEAQLTHLRSRLVDEKQLGKIGAKIGLGELMRLGKGADKDGGRENPSLLNDTFEAMIGAYFLDMGIGAARLYIVSLFEPLAKQLISNSTTLSSDVQDEQIKPQSTFIDSKNRFQQWALANHQVMPRYQIISELGPDHAKQFKAQVLVNGKVFGEGEGSRKQAAEKQAAEAALKSLG